MKKRLFVLLVLFTVIATSVFANGDKETKATKASNSLVIYSPQADSERGEWILNKCKEATGLDVQFLTAGGGELSDRLIAEKKNPQADIVFGLVQTAMYQLKTENIFEPYRPSWANDIPAVYCDKDAQFHCFWQTPIVIAYNTDFYNAQTAPQDWVDLAKPQYKGKYTIGGTSSQTIRSFLIGILWNYYDYNKGDVTDEGWNVLRQIYLNAASAPAGGNTWTAMKEGTNPLNLSWFGGIKSKTEANEIPVAYVKPVNGTPIVSESIAIIKGTKNLENAKKFVEWFGSPEFMAEYANQFKQAPVHPQAIENCIDEVKEDALMFTAQDIDWEIAATHMFDWLEKIELEIMP